MKKRTASFVLAGLSGVSLAIAMPGPGLWPTLLFFPGLWLEALRPSRRWWHGALLGLVAGTIHWVVAVHWVVDVLSGYGGIPVPGAWAGLVLMAVILGTTWAGTGALVAAVDPGRRPLVLSLAWVLFEVLRRYPPFLFPWNTMASCLAGRPELLGSLPVWGSSGLGWALVAVGAGGWALLRNESRRHGAVLVVAAALLLSIASLLAPKAHPVGELLTVGVIQPGTSLEERWDPSSWPETSKHVWRLSDEVAEQGADIILWPESAMPYRIDSDPGYRLGVHRLSERTGAVVVLNSVAAMPEGGYSNSAFAVHPDGSLSRYDKIHLVPFGEYVPLWARWFFSDSLVREVGDFSPGTRARPLRAGVPMGMAVCYEIVFPNLMAEQVRAGAQVLVTLTNDAWYGSSWALDQHFAQAVLRSVENRRWVVRAALTGISGAIDPTGRIVGRIDAGEQGVMVVAVEPCADMTPASRWGDWWPLVCLCVLLVNIFPRLFARMWPYSSHRAGRDG